MNRRAALIGTAGAITTAGLGGFAKWSAKDNWRQMVETIHEPIRPGLSGGEALRELVRYATLAANSHNSQAWRFEIGQETIALLPDFNRRTPIVDPDDHHLYVSLGAAAENIVQAAPTLGLSAEVQFLPDGDERIILRLRDGPEEKTPMAEAIPRRQCTRSLYDGHGVGRTELELLAAAGGGQGIELQILTERTAINGIGTLVVEGNNIQMGDHAYIGELLHWLRFGYADATSSGDGLFSATSGNPVLPAMLGRLMFPLIVTANGEAQKYLAQIASSAGLAIFVSEQNDKAHWIAAGRAYQRFALQATALGIKHAFLNQAVEVTTVRNRLAEHLSLGERRPDRIVRFGYAQNMPGSMRRPLADVVS